MTVKLAVSGADLVRRIHGAILAGLRDGLVIDSYPRQAIASLAGVTVRRLLPVAGLLDDDFLEEAGILARTSLELAISAAYIWFASEDERELRARRFFAHEAVMRMRDLDQVFKHEARDTMFGRFPSLEPKEAELRAAFAQACAEFPGIEKRADRWSALSTPDMVRAVNDTDARTALMFTYDLAYRSLSAYVHPCVQAIRVAAPGAQRGEETLAFGAPIVATEAAVAAVRCLCAAYDIPPPETDAVFRACVVSV